MSRSATGAGSTARTSLDDGHILLLERDDDAWRPLHTTFDRDVDDDAVGEANRWVALQPGSPFAGRLVAMRTTDDLRERLVGTRLERAPADGEPTTDELTPAAALDALERHFGVAVDEDDRAALRQVLEAGSVRA